jgi:hypothetical protein
MMEQLNSNPVPIVNATSPTIPPSTLGIVLSVVCILASFIGLTCFVAGIAALLQLKPDPLWLVSNPRGLAVLSMQAGFGIGTLLLFDAAWACFRSRWRRAGISFVIGTGLVGALVWYAGTLGHA